MNVATPRRPAVRCRARRDQGNSLAQARLLLEQKRVLHGQARDTLAGAVAQVGEANEVITEYQKSDKRRNAILALNSPA